ncbi:hypothetical protein KIPB_015430 [Kipferlia bialata]|uniref:Uncharacterized protein n=1 Tax=Kipferlia bialata TaxID=797122 RepID=A0A9K3DBU4_9EUKA|nr:hypothetical protein KIPB_015430 [Kipferlia bialata]|eukprot:g15430.t1
MENVHLCRIGTVSVSVRDASPIAERGGEGEREEGVQVHCCALDRDVAVASVSTGDTHSLVIQVWGY